MSTHPSQIAASAAIDRLPVTPAAPRRDEAPRRPDRHGHRLRLPQRARRRGGRRRHRARRRLGRDDRARLPVDRRASSSTSCSCSRAPCGAACARRCSSATCRSAPTRSPTSRRSPTRCASSRRPAATRSSSRAAGRRPCARARAIVGAGIPVMGHVGLTPQTATALGGYRAQGRNADAAARVAADALALQDGRLLLDRLRGDPLRRRRAAHAAHRGPGDRDRRRARDRRPGARLPRPARDPRGARRALRQALRRPAGRDGRRRGARSPTTCARAATRRPSTATRSMPQELLPSCASASSRPDADTRVPGHGPALAGLRAEGPRLLRSLRGGGRQRAARRRAARRDAARTFPSTTTSRARSCSASRRATGSRTT